jgi:hypothetical protein
MNNPPTASVVFGLFVQSWSNTVPNKLESLIEKKPAQISSKIKSFFAFSQALLARFRTFRAAQTLRPYPCKGVTANGQNRTNPLSHRSVNGI